MAGPDVQREGENEARLRRERLASSRLPDFNPPAESPAPQAGPTGAHGGDQAAGGLARQQSLETTLNRQRRQEAKPENEAGKQGGGGPSLRDAAMLAKASPAGAVAGTLMNAGPGKPLPLDEIQRGVGRGCVRMLWQFLWPSLGHTIYFICIIFFIAWASKFARKYVPEVGEEWIPPDLLKKIPKPMLIPIKLAEILALSFILFWTLMFDLLCIGTFAMILAIIFTVT